MKKIGDQGIEYMTKKSTDHIKKLWLGEALNLSREKQSQCIGSATLEQSAVESFAKCLLFRYFFEDKRQPSRRQRL